MKMEPRKQLIEDELIENKTVRNGGSPFMNIYERKIAKERGETVGREERTLHQH
jgi:hypothetical protein